MKNTAVRPSLPRVLTVQIDSILGQVGLATVAVTLALSAAIAFNVVTTDVANDQGAFGLGTLDYPALAQAISMAVALLFPSVVWDGLPPNRRWALHGMPIPRRHHEMLRVFIGFCIVGIATIVFQLVAVICMVTLVPDTPRWPEVSSWVLVAASLAILYGLGSIAGLLTRSALSTITRVLVWGFMAMLVFAIIGNRNDSVARVNEWVTSHVLNGSFGLLSGVLSGLRGVRGVAEPAWMATMVWVVIVWAAVWVSAGRHPRRGRA